MFVKIVDFLGCLADCQKVRLDFTFCTVEGQSHSILEDELFQSFDFSEAVTNYIHFSFETQTVIISVYSIDKDDLPSD